MDGEIKNMVADDVIAACLPAEPEAQVCDLPCFVGQTDVVIKLQAVGFRRLRKIAQVSYEGVVDYKVCIVELEGDVKGV